MNVKDKIYLGLLLGVCAFPMVIGILVSINLINDTLDDALTSIPLTVTLFVYVGLILLFTSFLFFGVIWAVFSKDKSKDKYATKKTRRGSRSARSSNESPYPK